MGPQQSAETITGDRVDVVPPGACDHEFFVDRQSVECLEPVVQPVTRQLDRRVAFFAKARLAPQCLNCIAPLLESI